MKHNLSDFNFFLPDSRIAQSPPTVRNSSKMMLLNKNDASIVHSRAYNISNYIDDSYFLVFNNTKVRKARMFADVKQDDKQNNRQDGKSDKKHEFLFVKKTDDYHHTCITKNLARKKISDKFILQGGAVIEIIEKEDMFVKVSSNIPIDENYFLTNGHIPLPPYIKRSDNEDDESRYQPVFSKEIGSIASPTASLHFDEHTLHMLKNKGVDSCFLTLHVGLGTFLPVKEDNILNHKMHYETYFISSDSARKINDAKASGKKILAVGTTAIRSLESCMTVHGKIQEVLGEETNLFIYPGYEFKIVDAILTNFHTPKSTLLMLISAFYGYDKTMSVYENAIMNDYRFFSYGDCMLIL